MSQILFLVLIFGVFYFFLIRPQQKKAKEEKVFRDNLSKGDKIVTIGGIFGTVEAIEDTAFIIKVDANTKLRMDKSAIRPVPAETEKTPKA